ncbi:MAG: hypothetical protein ACOYWZ_14455 [Bacillota bacterium]
MDDIAYYVVYSQKLRANKAGQTIGNLLTGQKKGVRINAFGKYCV